MAKERKGFNFYKSYFDVYQELSDKEKVKFMDALLQRQFWGVEPTALGAMSKFAYISQKHNIDTQVKGYEDKTGVTLHPPTAPPPVGVNTPPPAQGEEEEEGKGKEEEEGEYPAVAPFVFKVSLINFGFKKELVDDFLKNRKTKKLSNTQTAYDSFIEEIEKTGREKNEVFKIIVVKGWGGFKASWNLEDDKPKTGPQDNGRYPTEDLTDFKF